MFSEFIGNRITDFLRADHYDILVEREENAHQFVVGDAFDLEEPVVVEHRVPLFPFFLLGFDELSLCLVDWFCLDVRGFIIRDGEYYRDLLAVIAIGDPNDS